MKTEIKNSLNGLNSSLDTFKKVISEAENRSEENIQIEAWREGKNAIHRKKTKTSEIQWKQGVSLPFLYYNCVIVVQEGEKRGNEAEKIFREMMPENFSKMERQ